MSELDLNRLRQFLDQEEQYARTIAPRDPRSAVAKRMLALIAYARARLRSRRDTPADPTVISRSRPRFAVPARARGA